MIDRMATLRAGFRTTRACGIDGLYELTIKFQNLDDLHSADEELRDALARERTDLGPLVGGVAPTEAGGVAAMDAFPMTGEEDENELGEWQDGSIKPAQDGTYLREFDEGDATSVFCEGAWLRDGFFPSDLQDVRWRGRASAPVAAVAQPVAGWKSVPVEPTDAMLKAGNKKTWPLPSQDVYRAMLAASPSCERQDEGAAKTEPLLSIWEQRAVLADLMGLECLINYHDCQEAGADAQEPGMGSGNARRALELLALGRSIIAEDPEIWHEEQKKAFDLRYSERQDVGGDRG